MSKPQPAGCAPVLRSLMYCSHVSGQIVMFCKSNSTCRTLIRFKLSMNSVHMAFQVCSSLEYSRAFTALMLVYLRVFVSVQHSVPIVTGSHSTDLCTYSCAAKLYSSFNSSRMAVFRFAVSSLHSWISSSRASSQTVTYATVKIDFV